MAASIDCRFDGETQGKTCARCGEMKPLLAFSVRRVAPDGLRETCKSCEAAAAREYRKRNAAKVAAYDRTYKLANAGQLREKARERAKKLRTADPDATRARKRAWSGTEQGRRSKESWRKANPDRERAHAAKRRAKEKYRIEATFRTQIHQSIVKGSKAGRRTFALLGYTVEDLKRHIERQFQGQMSWDNYGAWHIDHVLPLSMFSYSTPDDQNFKAAWALTNLRPLWAAENIKKSSRRIHLL